MPPRKKFDGDIPRTIRIKAFDWQVDRQRDAIRAEIAKRPQSPERDALLQVIYQQTVDRRNHDGTVGLHELKLFHGSYQKGLRRARSFLENFHETEQPTPEQEEQEEQEEQIKLDGKDKERQRQIDAAGLLSHQLRAVDLLRAGLTRDEICRELGIKREAFRQLFNRIKLKTRTARSSQPEAGE